MGRRISFNSNELRLLFFEECLKKSHLKNWKELSQKLNIKRNLLGNYRSGKLTVPEEIYKKLIINFSEKDLAFFETKILFLDKNWGRSKAGKITYSKHKEIFNEGRRKAIKKSIQNSIKFDINLPLTKNLSYFIGLFIGDGFTNKYQGYYLTQFVGNSIDEEDYYKETLSKISKDLFGLIPKIRKEKKLNALRINFYSKNLFLLLTNRFKLQQGRKSNTVLIPKEIINSNSEILLSCISGIYDAEASVYFDKRKAYKKKYPIIELHLNNPLLIRQIDGIFNKYNLGHYVRDNFSRIYFYGEKNFVNFIKKINFRNPKHIRKII